MASLPGNQVDINNLQVTLENICQRLSSLDRVETKIDNINERVESLEQRLSAVENDNDHHQGNIDVLRAEMASVKTDVNKLKQDRAVNQNQLQSRVEYLENRDRCRNIKLLNIPIQANETPDKCKSTVIGVLKHIFPNLDESHVCI